MQSQLGLLCGCVRVYINTGFEIVEEETNINGMMEVSYILVARKKSC